MNQEISPTTGLDWTPLDPLSTRPVPGDNFAKLVAVIEAIFFRTNKRNEETGSDKRRKLFYVT